MFFISSYTMWWTQGILSYLPVPYDEGIWNTAISSARLWFNYILVTVTKQEFVFNALYLHSVWYFTVWIMSCTVHFVVIQFFFVCVLPSCLWGHNEEGQSEESEPFRWKHRHLHRVLQTLRAHTVWWHIFHHHVQCCKVKKTQKSLF